MAAVPDPSADDEPAAPRPPGVAPRVAGAGRVRQRRRQRLARASATRRGLARVAPWAGRLLVGTLLAAGLASALAVAWLGATGRDPYRLGAPGVHFEGDALPAGHALLRPRPATPGVLPVAGRLPAGAPGQAVAAGPGSGAAAAALPAEPPLAYRQRCVWGQPGRNPYRGTVVQALQSAHLPDEVVRAVAANIAAGQPTDRLEIRREGIRALGSGRRFDPRRVALTYGQTLCVNARVNFAAGHMEPAALYEAADAAGRVYAVMVPEVCGNVSVLSQQGERARPRLLAVAEEAPPGPLRRLPAALEDGGGEGLFAFADDRPAQTVPEPGTLLCVVLGLAALALVRRRR